MTPTMSLQFYNEIEIRPEFLSYQVRLVIGRLEGNYGLVSLVKF